MRSEHCLHLVCEWWNHVPGDEEGGHIKQVQEDLVPIAQRRSQIAVSGRTASAELLRSEHSLNHDHVISWN